MLNFKKTYSEKALVEGCCQNDRRCQEELYRRFFPTMMQMCMRYSNDQSTAMEIVNNGFLRVFKKIDTFGFKGSLEGWIRRLVFNSISEHFKNESKYLQFIVLDEADKPLQQSVMDELYYDDLLNLVEQLPPSSKEVFRLFAIEGYSHDEIAKQLNITEGTSKWHLSNARQKLKELIEKNNQQYHAG